MGGEPGVGGAMGGEPGVGGAPGDCDDGAVQRRPCGENGRGTETRRCEGGAWSAFDACVDTDECADDAAEEEACAGGGTRTRQCSEGRWTPWGACDGAVCVPDDEQVAPCGLNGRGARLRVCGDAGWGPFGDCQDPDVCIDGDSQVEGCGMGGTHQRVCAAGAWAAWGECRGGAECDPNTQEAQVCGLNERGLEVRRCVEGVWGPYGECEDPDACRNGARQEQACGPMGNGLQARICAAGQWADWGACEGDGQCMEGAAEQRACGLNNRGTAARVCLGGVWQELGGCTDPDVCIDAAREEQACGRNARGVRQRTCANGQWGALGVCQDPDVCTDGAVGEQACGLNGRGVRRRTCGVGQWGDFGACQDPDVCTDGAIQQQACPDDGGVSTRACTRGQWGAFTGCPDGACQIDGDCAAGQFCRVGGNVGVCVAEQCGDGHLGGQEACDDGNRVGGDGCDANCALEGSPVGGPCDPFFGPFCVPTAECDFFTNVCVAIVCGDGNQQGDEACDDGNQAAGDGCEACRIVPIPEGNACAPGGTYVCAQGTVCSPASRTCVQPFCGDGVRTGNEACDDGNQVAGDGCEACRIVPIPVGHACRAGGPYPCVAGAYCDPATALCAETVCGDGVASGAEQCDDANAIAGDGCSAECRFDPWHDPVEPDSLDAPYDLVFDDHRRGGVVFSNTEPGDAADFIRFELPEDALLSFDTWRLDMPTLCSGDPVATLFDADGIEVAEDDDSGVGLCSKIDALALPAGVYVLRIAPFGQTHAISGVWLSIGWEPAGGQGDVCEPDANPPMCGPGLSCVPGSGTCEFPTCGNGLVEAGEACDDGNAEDGDGCADCQEADILEGFPCEADGFGVLCEAGLFCGVDLIGTSTCRAFTDLDGPCDRRREASLCIEGLECKPTNAAGTGVCALPPFRDLAEIEPNESSMDAAALLLGPNDAVIASLPLGDAYDLFVLDLAAEAHLVVDTDDGTIGSCRGIDTVLYRVDAALLDTQGRDAAVAAGGRLDYNDDGGEGLCSRLEGTYPRGRYYFLVEEYGRDGAIANYALRFRSVPLRAGGQRCDVERVFSQCIDGLVCDDPNADNDGICH